MRTIFPILVFTSLLNLAVAALADAQPAPYGLIGKLSVRPGQRDALAADLPQGCSGMAGCLSYIVAKDAADPDAIWVTEVWESKASHDASLSQPVVRAAIAAGRPLIAGMQSTAVTIPVAGVASPPPR